MTKTPASSKTRDLLTEGFSNKDFISTWVIPVITIFSTLLIVFCSYTLFKKRKKDPKNSRMEVEATNDTSTMKTLVNTNIGLSDHLSLQQDSSLFTKVRSLAKGGQAEVFLIKIINGKTCSNHAVQKVFFNSAISKDILLHEVSVMAMLKKYPYFVSIIAYTLEPVSIVMRSYPEGSLDEWIKRNKLCKILKLGFSYELAYALKTMHSHSFAHCDIKSQNVLIDVQGGEPHCCLSDFGITQILSDAIVVVKAYQILRLRGISCTYASPESFQVFEPRKIGFSSMAIFTPLVA